MEQMFYKQIERDGVVNASCFQRASIISNWILPLFFANFCEGK